MRQLLDGASDQSTRGKESEDEGESEAKEAKQVRRNCFAEV